MPTALLRSGTQLLVSPFGWGLETQDAAVCGAQCHRAQPRRSWQGMWPSLGKQAGQGSDPEALLPAIDVAEPQVDICANALQGLQLQGTPEVLCVGPRRGQPEAKAMHGS